MAKIDLSKYGITGTTEVVYNPSYEMLFEEETKMVDVLEHAGKFYENCKKMEEKSESIFNAMEKM